MDWGFFSRISSSKKQSRIPPENCDNRVVFRSITQANNILARLHKRVQPFFVLCYSKLNIFGCGLLFKQSHTFQIRQFVNLFMEVFSVSHAELFEDNNLRLSRGQSRRGLQLILHAQRFHCLLLH